MHIPPIEIHDLTVAYQKKPVLYGVDLKINAGRLIGIIGPNGAGKSTLVKAIMGVVKPSSGWIKIFDQPASRALHHIGYVPQRESIDWDFPVHVQDVVMMGRYGHLKLGQRPGKKDHEKVLEAIDQVQLMPYLYRQIGGLSGGQQQRVFLARALAQDAPIYLMDEPFAGVDAATQASILNVLQAMQQAGKTILVVHHDLTSAKQYFDELILLNMRLIAYGPVDQVFTSDLLQKTYGGRLTILSEVTQAVSHIDHGD